MTETNSACANLSTIDEATKSAVQPSVSLSKLQVASKQSRWADIVLPTRPTNAELLSKLFQNNVNPDMAIVIDGCCFMTHSLALRASSSFFYNLGAVRTVHLPADKISKSAFVSLYTWTVCHSPRLHRKLLVEMFCASKFLGMESLQEMCWAAFEDFGNCEEQSLLLFEEARSFNVFIKDVMFSRINRCFLTYVASKEYQELSDLEICDLLCRNSIGVNTEEEVFMAAVVWLSYKWPERMEHAKSVMECVRFAQMPLAFLSTFKHRRETKVIEYLSHSKEVVDIMEQCLVKLKEYKEHGFTQTDFFAKRLWIFDPKCAHHHTPDCKWLTLLTYVAFINYLGYLQTHSPGHYLTLKGVADTDITCCLAVDNDYAQEGFLALTSKCASATTSMMLFSDDTL